MKKMKAKDGDHVEIKYDSEVLKGIIMPSSKNNITLKLDSGYNILLDKSKIKSMKVIKKLQKKSVSLQKVKHNNDLKTILILHTGGTIASKVSYETGGVISSFTPEEILDMFPELNKIANLKSELAFNIFSEDMNFSYYKALIKKIKDNVNKVDGIIVTHGTDTLGYTSAALSFVFENLPIPIILVGSQRSSDRGSSDAAMNLICAANFIAKSNFKDVAICMHSSSSDTICDILPACKTRKLHTSRRDAFKSVNSDIIAKVDYQTLEVDNTNFPQREEKLVIKDKLEEKVGILKVYPNLDKKQIKSFSTYKGLIIEGTGLGHISNDIIKEIKNLTKKGVVVVMTSQCIFGRVNMNVYSTGRELMESDVISGEDMLTETAYIKLAWLLGNFKKDQVKYMINDNLRGEINKKILYEEDFLKCSKN